MVPAGFVSSLSTETRSALFASGHEVGLDRGETLFTQGEPTRSVGVVLSGHLKLTAVGTTGRGLVVGLWGPGDLAGHVTAITRTTRVGTATAMDRAALFVVPSARFETLLDEIPEMSRVLVRELAGVAEAAVRSQTAQGTDRASVRVARLLAELCDPSAASGPARRTDLRFDLSQDELGQIVGASRESVARTLRNFREEGVVSTGRRQLTVERLERLREIAQLSVTDTGAPAERLVRLPSD